MSDSPGANPRLLSYTRRLLRFTHPNTHLNVKEQIAVHHAITRTFPAVSISCIIVGELFAAAVLRRFSRKLNLAERPYRVYLAYVGCGLVGAVAPLPILPFLMERAIMKLPTHESPQSAILHAQAEERERLRELKKLGYDPKQGPKEEYDWEEKEKLYINMAEKVRQEEEESKKDSL